MKSAVNIDAKRAAWPALLAKLLDIVTRFSLYLSGGALFLILVCYVFEVILRYFFNSPSSWSNDVIRLLFAAMIMLALAEMTRIHGHIVISYFLEKMKPTSRHKLERGIALIGCIMCFFAAYICFQESLRQYQQNIQALWNTPIPKWWISGFVPYGFMLSGLQMLRSTFSRKED